MTDYIPSGEANGLPVCYSQHFLHFVDRGSNI